MQSDSMLLHEAGAQSVVETRLSHSKAVTTTDGSLPLFCLSRDGIIIIRVIKS